MKEKEAKNLKNNKNMYMRGFRGRKQKGEL